MTNASQSRPERNREREREKRTELLSIFWGVLTFAFFVIRYHELIFPWIIDAEIFHKTLKNALSHKQYFPASGITRIMSARFSLRKYFPRANKLCASSTAAS